MASPSSCPTSERRNGSSDGLKLPSRRIGGTARWNVLAYFFFAERAPQEGRWRESTGEHFWCYVRVEGRQVTWPWQIAKTLKTCLPPKSTLKDSSTIESYMQKPRHVHVRAVLSEYSISLALEITEGNLMPDEEEKEEQTSFQEEKRKRLLEHEW